MDCLIQGGNWNIDYNSTQSFIITFFIRLSQVSKRLNQKFVPTDRVILFIILCITVPSIQEGRTHVHICRAWRAERIFPILRLLLGLRQKGSFLNIYYSIMNAFLKVEHHLNNILLLTSFCKSICKVYDIYLVVISLVYIPKTIRLLNKIGS